VSRRSFIVQRCEPTIERRLALGVLALLARHFQIFSCGVIAKGLPGFETLCEEGAPEAMLPGR
jgi:hypothetical protein